MPSVESGDARAFAGLASSVQTSRAFFAWAHGRNRRDFAEASTEGGSMIPPGREKLILRALSRVHFWWEWCSLARRG